MNQRARSKSWMPMSRIIPPLLFGSAYSSVVRWGSREVDLNTHGRADGALLELALGRRVAGVEAAHEAHLEEDAGAASTASFMRPASRRRVSAGGFSQKVGLPARSPPRSPGPCGCCVGLTMTTASTSDVVDERRRVGVASAARRTRPPRPRAAVGVDVGHRHEARLGDAGREVARVDAPQAAEADEADPEPPRASQLTSRPPPAVVTSSIAPAGPREPLRP